MAKKKEAAAKVEKDEVPDAPRKESKLRKGTGTRRTQTRFVVLYGMPKVRKTGSTRNIAKRAKWIITDSNCIPTLSVLDALPHADDIYECGTLQEIVQLLNEMLDVCEQEGPEALGCDFIVHDSITATSDMYQQDLAKSKGGDFLGQNKNDGGWQHFNAKFGEMLDLFAALSRHITVIMIGHAKEKMESGRGEWAGLSLPPQMALKLGRLANWVLYQTRESRPAEDTEVSDKYVEIVDSGGLKTAYETIIHTKPFGKWIASVNSKNLNAEEPADLAELLTAEGLMPS